jgi:hypothetical protein
MPYNSKYFEHIRNWEKIDHSGQLAIDSCIVQTGILLKHISWLHNDLCIGHLSKSAMSKGIGYHQHILALMGNILGMIFLV